MLIVISPAKTLDFESPAKTKLSTLPDYLDASESLVGILRDYSAQEIAQLMGVSDKIAGLNVARFQEWQIPYPEDHAKQALLAFKGDVYTGLDAESFQREDFLFAQKHLRILSGLYGLLRPMDLMLPYRLEMGTKLGSAAGKDLYAFWGETITQGLNQQLKPNEVLVNLASNEYFKAVKPKLLKGPVITPIFKDEKNGKYKIISFFAKKARGLMAAYAIKHRINDPEQLKAFDEHGYCFNPAMSSETEWVFLRPEQ